MSTWKMGVNEEGGAMQRFDDWLGAQNKWAALLLRIGIATVFLYAALSSLISPRDWVGYVPDFAAAIVPAYTLLTLLSVVELLLAAWLLSGVYVRVAALVAAGLLLAITISNLALLPISFRDIGLLFAALALAVIKPCEHSRD